MNRQGSEQERNLILGKDEVDEDTFSTSNYEQTLYNQYQNSGQGGRTMANYIEEFQRLGARTSLMKNEQHLIARFVGGLRMDIKEKVKLQSFN